MSARQEDVTGWKQFTLTITDPPSHSEHFKLVKDHLIPFVEKTGVRCWVTNYRDPSQDSIFFRVKVDRKEMELTQRFLDELVNRREIVRWDLGDWNPEEDARNRIASASQKLGLPRSVAFKMQGPYIVNQEIAFDERVEQLRLIFAEAVGSCTKVLYKALKSKPTDPWMMSVFIHLILNSIDVSGPTPPCEESSVRYMPPY